MLLRTRARLGVTSSVLLFSTETCRTLIRNAPTGASHGEVIQLLRKRERERERERGRRERKRERGRERERERERILEQEAGEGEGESLEEKKRERKRERERGKGTTLFEQSERFSKFLEENFRFPSPPPILQLAFSSLDRKGKKKRRKKNNALIFSILRLEIR